MRKLMRGTVGCAIAAACCLGATARLGAIETTYGEDPVPNTTRIKGFLNLGYGADPVPDKTLSQRWRAWRASRQPMPQVYVPQRPGNRPGMESLPPPPVDRAPPETIPTPRMSKKIQQYSHERLSGRNR